MATAPAVNRRILESLLEERLPAAKALRLVLVYGRYADTVTEFTVTHPARRRVQVTDQHSVLGIVEAWQEHRTAHADDDDVLVVTTSVEDDQLGWDIRAYAVRQQALTVDRAQIVGQRFGAGSVDPRIRAERWLVDALLDAEPPQGWPRNGSVLTRDAAVRALIGARLGGAALGAGTLDAGALLEWSRDPAGPQRFISTPPAERDGLTAWLADTVGPIAPLLLRLATTGRAGDAMPLGVVAWAVTRPGARSETGMAFGGLVGSTVSPLALQALTEAVEGTLERWISEANTTTQQGEEAQHRVLAVLRRADELAAEAHLTEALADNRFLASGFTARLCALAATLTAKPSPAAVAEAEAALGAVRDHGLAQLDKPRVETAQMAVRLLRWLASPPREVPSVAAGVREQMTEWAWVDRALNTLWAGDSAGDRVVGQAYRAVCEAVRSRRDTLDEQFAQRLATWAPHASSREPGGCLLVEDVLTTVALPLAAERAPLIVVLDGLSAAVATELGEQLSRQAWIEASPQDRRIAAVAAIPSVTRASRASLLTGNASIGDQPAERDGFTAFWRRHHQPGALLFHMSDVAGPAGHRLAEPLVTALGGDGVVGVVLNTIDDALDHGREGDRTAWQLRDITYLPELLDTARGFGRPVVLASDHGHVLERFTGAGPVNAPGVESARWRIGTPTTGEVALTGSRVLYGDRTIVAPWREDIRYTARKSGYHGGAALAEMTVPVLVLLPSADDVPQDWQPLSPEAVTPSWWEQAVVREPVSPPPVRKAGKSRKQQPQDDAAALFSVDDGVAAGTLGQRVVATEVYEGQRAFVPMAPAKDVVATVIDALVEGGTVLSLTAVAAKAGRAGRQPEFLAATLQRLLNVDGYPVLSLVDGDRRLKLETETLRWQFGVREP